MSDSIGVSMAMGLIKTIVCLYDVVTLPVYFLAQKPWEVRRLSNQTKAVQKNERDPYSPWVRIGGENKHFIKGCSTAHELFNESIKRFGERQCLGKREVFREEDERQKDGKNFRKLILGDYNWYTYRDIDKRIEDIGRGLLSIGVKPRETIMIFAETRLEWFLTAMACFRIGCSITTLYATLGDDGIVHGINEAEVSHLVTTFDLLPKLQKLQSRLPHVRHVIYIEGHKKAQTEGFESRITIHPFATLEEKGKNASHLKGEKPKPDDLAVLMYTSGSTGIPKGVQITHKNLINAISAFLSLEEHLRSDDVYMGYLPLAHVLELSAECFFFCNGIPIGYSTPHTMTDRSTAIKTGQHGDAVLLRPSIMAAVPLVLDRIRKGVAEQVDSRGKFFKALFSFLVDYKKFWTRKGFNTPIVNKLICKKPKAMIGGRVRLIASGGAPLSPDTHDFIRAVLDVKLIQGYGLTETTASATLMDPNDLSVGCAGAPLPGVLIKLVDWAEGGYRVTDKPNPRGEIVIGGESITAGYFKNDKLTQESYKDEDGNRWFYTGDIGEILPDGNVKIIDRKKDLVKLQFGEYISLGKVEAELKNCPYVENICVYGDSLHTYLIALVVPNPKSIDQLAQRLGKQSMSRSELLKDPDVIREVTNAIYEHGIKAKLHRTEIPTKIKLVEEEWLPDSGLVTAAFKLRRKNIQDYYKKDINRLYGMTADNGVGKST